MKTNEIKISRVVTKTQRGQVAYAEPVNDAAKKGIIPQVVFIRDDGWSLGARYRDAKAAQRLWAGQWVRGVDLVTNEEVRF